MAVASNRTGLWVLHPIHGVLLASTIPLFLGALLSDYAYTSSYEIQWSNFASWLIFGGLVFGGIALVLSIIRLIKSPQRSGLSFIYPFLLLLTWIFGFINSLIHAKDAWATMPEGIIFSIIVVLLACASTWIGFAKFGVGGIR